MTILKIPHTGDTKSLDWINADRHTDTERNIQGFLSSLGDLVREGGGGLVCTVRPSTGLHLYPLNYTVFVSKAVHFTARVKKYKVSMHMPWTVLKYLNPLIL